MVAVPGHRETLEARLDAVRRRAEYLRASDANTRERMALLLSEGGDVEPVRQHRREAEAELRDLEDVIPLLERDLDAARAAEAVREAEALTGEAREAHARAEVALQALFAALAGLLEEVGRWQEVHGAQVEAVNRAKAAWEATGVGIADAMNRVGAGSDVPWAAVGVEAWETGWRGDALRSLTAMAERVRREG